MDVASMRGIRIYWLQLIYCCYCCHRGRQS